MRNSHNFGGEKCTLGISPCEGWAGCVCVLWGGAPRGRGNPPPPVSPSAPNHVESISSCSTRVPPNIVATGGWLEKHGVRRRGWQWGFCEIQKRPKPNPIMLILPSYISALRVEAGRGCEYISQCYFPIPHPPSLW